MPASYYHERFSFSALPTAITWPDLTDKDGQTIPTTFTNVPTINVFSKVSRPLFVVDGTVTVTGCTINGGVGGAAPPWLGDIQVLSSDPLAVPPPASTDLTGSIQEPLCTPLDVLLTIGTFSPPHTQLQEVLQFCLDQRSLIGEMILYDESGLKQTAPWSSAIVPGSIYMDPRREESNVPVSLAIDGADRSGLRVVLPSTTLSAVFTQMYEIIFDTATAFTVTGHIEGVQGSGSTSSDFLPSNADFRIQSAAWFGTFRPKDRFYFSLYPWHPEIVMIAKRRAAASLLTLKYSEDAIKENGLAKSFMEWAIAEIEAYNLGDTIVTRGNRTIIGKALPSLSKRTWGYAAKPHDIDLFGRDMTPRPSGNQDFLGNRGEFTGFDSLCPPTGDWPC